MDNNFPNNLRHMRLQKGLTQEELGKILDKDYSTIGKWENGTRSPIMEDALKVADFFNVSLEEMICKNIYEQNTKSYDELELLFSKHKNILTDEDKEYMKFIIEKRKKEIDKQLGEE